MKYTLTIVTWRTIFQIPSTVTIPPNVLVNKFTQQQPVLAHNNTAALICHVGGHTIYEAIWYGIPLIGIPIFADQIDRLAHVVKRGIGVGLERADMDANKIERAVKEIFANKR